MIKLLKLAAFAAMALILTGCGVVKGVKNPTADTAIQILKKSYPFDNILEEALENKIEDWTGVDIDLTPSSPES